MAPSRKPAFVAAPCSGTGTIDHALHALALRRPRPPIHDQRGEPGHARECRPTPGSAASARATSDRRSVQSMQRLVRAEVLYFLAFTNYTNYTD